MKTKLIIGLIAILTLMGLVATIVIQNNKIEDLNNDLITATTNVKAYEEEASQLRDKTIQFQLTVDQLNNSKDSLINKLNNTRKEIKVKDKKIKELEYIASLNQKKDSILIRDTIFVRDAVLDTLVNDKWASLKLHLEYPNIVVADYSFNNETSVITSTERVTVDPPKKCWLARLFQKKQDIVVVKVVQENPYCTTKEQKFINVIE